MNLFTLAQATILLAALVTAAPSFHNQIGLESKLHNLVKPEIIKSSNLLPREQDYSDEEADNAITSFLNQAMLSYSSWLAQEDPLQPDPTEVTLITGGFDFPDLDSEMKIRLFNYLSFAYSELIKHLYQFFIFFRNQYIANHSIPERFYVPSSNFEIRFIHVPGGLLVGLPITFGGDYVVNGTLKLSDTLNLPFSGQGRFSLKGNEFMEVINYRGYTINENGYIELANTSSIEYAYYVPNWHGLDFEDLHFNYDGEVDASWTSKLTESLAHMYSYLLVDFYEEFTWNNLPKRLLHTYLSQCLLVFKIKHFGIS